MKYWLQKIANFLFSPQTHKSMATRTFGSRVFKRATRQLLRTRIFSARNRIKINTTKTQNRTERETMSGQFEEENPRTQNRVSGGFQSLKENERRSEEKRGKGECREQWKGSEEEKQERQKRKSMEIEREREYVQAHSNEKKEKRKTFFFVCLGFHQKLFLESAKQHKKKKKY
jgi:hypothetical protein